MIVRVYYRAMRSERAAIEGANLSISPFFLLRAGSSFFGFRGVETRHRCQQRIADVWNLSIETDTERGVRIDDAAAARMGRSRRHQCLLPYSNVASCRVPRTSFPSIQRV